MEYLIRNQKRVGHCLGLATLRYSEAKKDALKEGKTLDENALKYIILGVEMQCHIDKGLLNAQMISDRVNSKNIYGFLVSEIEPMIVHLIVQDQTKGLYRTKEEILVLARNCAFNEQYMDYMEMGAAPLDRSPEEGTVFDESWFQDFCNRYPQIVHKRNDATIADTSSVKSSATSEADESDDIILDNVDWVAVIQDGTPIEVKDPFFGNDSFRRERKTYSMDDPIIPSTESWMRHDHKPDLLLHCTIIATQRYSEVRKQAKNELKAVKKDTLKNILKDVEEEFYLKPGSLDSKTVSRRTHSQSIYGFLVREIEPLIASLVTTYRPHGFYSTKKEIIEMSRECAFYMQYWGCVDMGVVPSNRSQDDDVIFGDKWFRGFKSRYPFCVNGVRK